MRSQIGKNVPMRNEKSSNSSGSRQPYNCFPSIITRNINWGSTVILWINDIFKVHVILCDTFIERWNICTSIEVLKRSIYWSYRKFSNWVWLLFGWLSALLCWRKPPAGFFLLSYHEQTEPSQLQFWAENKIFIFIVNAQLSITQFSLSN